MNEEYDDLEIEFDLTPEEIDAINESLKFSNIRYVYFDKTTGDILSTTDQKKSDIDASYFEINSEDLGILIPPGETVANFKVVTDVNNKFEIVPKVIRLNFKSISLIPIPYADNSATVTFFNDIENKNWIIVLDEEEKQRLHNAVANYMKQVYIVSQENKNILYRVFDIDLNELIAKGSVTVPHELVIESILSKIRLFTIKFFDSYAVKEMYEPKI